MAATSHKQPLSQRLSDALESPASAFRELKAAKESSNIVIFGIWVLLLVLIILLVAAFVKLSNKMAATPEAGAPPLGSAPQPLAITRHLPSIMEEDEEVLSKSAQ